MRPRQTRHHAYILVGLPTVAAETGLSEVTPQVFECHRHVILLAEGDLGVYFPADSGYLPLQTAHTRFTRVVVDDVCHDLFLEPHLAGFESVVGEFFRNQMPFGNLLFLFLKIAGHLDQLHSVEQRPRNGLQAVGGGDEQHFAQVVINIQIVVVEGAVLFRIQHFEQRSGRVTFVIRADLIYLVQHKNRVACAAFPDTVNDPSGQGTDVCSAVSADLRLVVQTAQRHPRIFPSEGFRHALSETRFAHSRRAVEA